MLNRILISCSNSFNFQIWHRRCFHCGECGRSLDSTNLNDGPDGDIYCRGCYGRKYGPHGVGFGMGAGTLTMAWTYSHCSLITQIRSLWMRVVSQVFLLYLSTISTSLNVTKTQKETKYKLFTFVVWCSTWGHIGITWSTYVFMGYTTPFATYVYLPVRNTSHIASSNVIFCSQISMAYITRYKSCYIDQKLWNNSYSNKNITECFY